MRSCILAASLSLLSSSYARQPLNYVFQREFCSAADGFMYPSFSDIERLPESESQHVLQELSPPKAVESQSKFHPWTEEPQCLTDKETNEEFCVYTNAKFASGRGISFFTSPKIATKMISLPALTEPGLYAHVNNFTDPPWEVRNVVGRGNGLFATRTLYRGDEIVSNTPVGVYQSDAFFPDYPMGYKYLHKAVEQLPKKTRKIFLKMAAHNPGDPVMERVNTNSFAGEFEGVPHFLLYPETAMMNHDCRPNSVYYHDAATLIHATFASRTIHPGEEITITYTKMLETRAERQEALAQTWGFECKCAICSAETSEVRRSDNRIRRIQELQGFLMDWSSESIGTPSMARELLALYDEEGVYAGLGTGHMLAALAYNDDGDMKNAKKHAKLAIEAGMVNSGIKDKYREEMESLLSDPRHHWSYNVR
ncbi:uncharacterized protein RSE6_14666 [Rhynchosporium secalis]|uniref:SET domain-containing protein n=1 Tax=Rhynchosporium secalis TaxID=38038 RepID=A0A1E1MVX0_RHYSE|nr:uncharacterized protein RSE6_14666 [Rhynchosporium secalis]